MMPLLFIGIVIVSINRPCHAESGVPHAPGGTVSPKHEMAFSNAVGLPMAADRIDLTPYLFYLEDQFGQLELSDIRSLSESQSESGSEALGFRPLGDQRGFGYSASSFWFRLVLENRSDEPVAWIVDYPYAAMDHIEFYHPHPSDTGDVRYKRYLGGDVHPFSSRPIVHKTMAFPIAINPGSHTFYFKLQSQGAIPAVLTGWNVDAFHRHAALDLNFNWFYYGCMLTMALFCLMLFANMKVPIYFYLFIFVSATTLCSMLHSGMASRYLLPNHPFWINLLHPLSGYIATLGYLLYSRDFLNIGKHFPLLDRCFLGIILLILFICVSIFFIPYRVATQSMMLMTGTVSILLSGTAARLALKGIRGAKIYTLSWSPFLVGIVLITLKSYGYLKNNLMTDSLLQLSSSTASILLCYGIIDKINQFRIDREKAVDKMHTAVKMYTLLAENITDVIWILELQTMDLIYITPSVEAMTGYTPDESENFTFKKMLTPDSANEAMTAVKRGIEKNAGNLEKPQENLTIETAFYHKNGEMIWTETSMTFTQDSLGNPLHMIGVTRDVTERRRAAEEKKSLEEKLFHAAKIEALATLSGGIAHDMNNILTSVLGYAQLSMDEADKESRLYQRLHRIIEACHRAKDLVCQILTFSRQDGAEDQILLIHLIVNEALKLIRSSLPSAIKIETDIQDRSLRIAINPTQLHRIIMNLCTNAAHAMDEHGGILGVSINKMVLDKKSGDKYFSIKPGEYVRLTVRDTGHGMEEKVLSRIFEPFFTTKPVGVGTGMGLSMVHGIVKKARGEIFVESEPGKGTTFDLIFPNERRKKKREPEYVNKAAIK